MKTRMENNEDPQLPVRTEQTRLIRCLLYGFVDYSGFETVIENQSEVRTASYGRGIDQSRMRNQSAL